MIARHLFALDDTTMTVAIKRWSQFWAQPPRNPGNLSKHLLRAIAVLILGVGVLSLISKSRVREVIEPWLNIHLLFSVLLVGFCVLQVFTRHCQTPIRASDMAEFSRALSRTVYVFIYAVIGLRQIGSIAEYLLYAGPMDFYLANEAQRGPDVAGFDLHNDFQAFITSGLAVLVVVRVLLYTMWWRISDERSAVSPRASHPSRLYKY